MNILCFPIGKIQIGWQCHQLSLMMVDVSFRAFFEGMWFDSRDVLFILLFCYPFTEFLLKEFCFRKIELVFSCIDILIVVFWRILMLIPGIWQLAQHCWFVLWDDVFFQLARHCWANWADGVCPIGNIIILYWFYCADHSYFSKKTAWFGGSCRCPATGFRRAATSHGVWYNRNPMQAPVAARSMGKEHLLKQRPQGRHLQDIFLYLYRK